MRSKDSLILLNNEAANPHIIGLLKDQYKETRLQELKALLANEEPQGLMTLVNPDCVEAIKEMIQASSKK